MSSLIPRPPFSTVLSSRQHGHLFASFLTLKRIHITTTATTTTTTATSPKIVVIMGATGAGKSRLSIDLATRFFKNSEIINSDKIQVYHGLDITTNKITTKEQQCIPHHLLGTFDPTQSVINPYIYRKLASKTISNIVSRNGLPLIVGGSNSFIYSLLTKQFNPNTDVFNGPDPDPVSSELRYKCCFIWVDVCFEVLNRYLCKRVDEMLDSGMVEELKEFFGSGEYLRVKGDGLGRAIGVREMEAYFSGGGVDLEVYDRGVRRVKVNSCELAERQVGKILRLKEGGWDLKRVNATEVVRRMMTAEGGGRVAELWEEVVETSVKIVNQFFEE